MQVRTAAIAALIVTSNAVWAHDFSDDIARFNAMAASKKAYSKEVIQARLALERSQGQMDQADIKMLLRNGAVDEQIAAAIRETVQRKWIGHEINSERFVPPPRPMYAIGG